MAIGFFQGSVATRLSIPTFVVTLAGLLTWQGAQLKVLGDDRHAQHHRPDADGADLDVLLGRRGLAARGGRDRVAGARGVAAPAAAGAQGLADRVDRAARWRASARPAAAIIATVAVLNADRGVPLALLILVALVMIVNTVLTRSTFGRHIYAIGGNAEAARRAGIRVQRIQTIVFMLASLFAAAGGDHGRLAPARGQSVLGRRRRAADVDRRAGRRGREPVRRSRLGLGRAAGRAS